MITRHLLEKYFGEDPRLVSEFEDQSNAVEAATNNLNGAFEATEAIKDAYVLVLSANSEFTNERLLVLGEGLRGDVLNNELIIRAQVVSPDNYLIRFLSAGDVEVTLPIEGTLIARENAGLANYANDAAAAAGGVAIGGLYHNAGAVRVRIA